MPQKPVAGRFPGLPRGLKKASPASPACSRNLDQAVSMQKRSAARPELTPFLVNSPRCLDSFWWLAKRLRRISRQPITNIARLGVTWLPFQHLHVMGAAFSRLV